jgi:hypothetical protein
MAGLVREASSVNNVLQINSRDIEDEVARIVAKQRKVSPELSGTTKALDADDPQGDGLQVSVGINQLAHAAANPQPLPLVLVGNDANKEYYLYTDECMYVPSTVTCVLIHRSVESLYNRAFYFCTSLVEVVLHDGLQSIGMRHLWDVNHCFKLSSHHLSLPLVNVHLLGVLD